MAMMQRSHNSCSGHLFACLIGYTPRGANPLSYVCFRMLDCLDDRCLHRSFQLQNNSTGAAINRPDLCLQSLHSCLQLCFVLKGLLQHPLPFALLGFPAQSAQICTEYTRLPQSNTLPCSLAELMFLHQPLMFKILTSPRMNSSLAVTIVAAAFEQAHVDAFYKPPQPCLSAGELCGQVSDATTKLHIFNARDLDCIIMSCTLSRNAESGHQQLSAATPS